MKILLSTFISVLFFTTAYTQMQDKIFFGKQNLGVRPTDIYTMNGNGNNQNFIYSDGGHVSHLSVSEDGSKLVYTSEASSTGAREIFIMNTDGTNHQQITVNNDGLGSSNGRFYNDTKIWYSRNSLEWWEMNYDGTGQSQIKNWSSLGNQSWAFSFNKLRTKVTYSRGTGLPQALDIYIANIDLTNEIRLTNNGTYDDDPRFSPDGSMIVWQRAGANGTMNIMVMRSDGSNQQQLTNVPAQTFIQQPMFSSDGLKIYYNYNNGSQTDIYVMNVDGTSQTNITNTPTKNEYLYWVVKNTGTISGNVTSNGNPLQNVLIKLLDEYSMPIINFSNQFSDASGTYTFADVPTGNYQVMIVEPLGYKVDQNPKVTTVVGGQTSIVDFNLEKVVIQNMARSKGYWKHQFDVYVSNKGKAQETQEQLSNYINLVQSRYTPHFGFYAMLTTNEQWQEILSVKGNAGMREKAKSQLAALVLNVVSLKIGQYEVVTFDGKTAGDVITYVSELIQDGDINNDELAKDLAERVNNQTTIDAGLVNPMQNILYKFEQTNSTKPDAYLLVQNYPNPFNPSTKISWQSPVGSWQTLKIYDVLGNEVATLVNEFREAGSYEVEFDALEISSGAYLYKFQAGNFIDTKKMILL